MNPLLRIERLSKRYGPGPGPAALDDLTLSLLPGEILSVLGPSGCGKTTLLRLVAGFEVPDSGTIHLNGKSVAGPGGCLPPEARGIGMVFQDFALFPHLNVAQNIGFGLKTRAPKRVAELLELVGLEREQNRYPHQISGGQQQRVALARALAPRTGLVLLDEPFSNLDYAVRLELREEVRQILKETRTAALFVTHDCAEALSLGDRLAVVGGGHLEQWDTPETIYRRPRTRFVASFVGRANFLTASRSADGRWSTELGLLELPGVGAGQSSLVLAIYPEAVGIDADPDGPVEVVSCAFQGRDYRYGLRLPSGQTWQALAGGEPALAPGSRCRVRLVPGECLPIEDSPSAGGPSHPAR